MARSSSWISRRTRSRGADGARAGERYRRQLALYAESMTKGPPAARSGKRSCSPLTRIELRYPHDDAARERSRGARSRPTPPAAN